jgi:hypothetical protein
MVVDPEHPDSTEFYRAVVVQRFGMNARLSSGDTLDTMPDLTVFHVVRGDVAVLAPGQAPATDRWYIRRWLANTGAIAEQLAADQGRCDEGKSGILAPRVVSPGLALAIHPLGNPACPSMDLRVDLAGEEPARIEVYDVTGRLVNRRDLAAPRPGTTVVSAGEGARILPGMYWVRLSQGTRRPTIRMIAVAR